MCPYALPVRCRARTKSKRLETSKADALISAGAAASAKSYRETLRRPTWRYQSSDGSIEPDLLRL